MGALGMRVESAKAVHATNHGFPVHRFFRRTEAHRANLVAVGTVHLEVQLIAHVIKFEHAECAIGRTLAFQFPSGGVRHLDFDAFGTGSNVFEPNVDQALLPGAYPVILFAQLIDDIAAVDCGKDARGFAVFRIVSGDEHAANAFAIFCDLAANLGSASSTKPTTRRLIQIE